MQPTFLAGPSPLIFAHRGLALDVPENTAAAFHAAVEKRVSHIESDVRASKDGIPVLYHDADMARVGGEELHIADLNFDEIAEVDLGGGHGVLSLDEALRQFPEARFNLDIKSADAAVPAAKVIEQHSAAHRVLLTSFSSRRRKRSAAAFGAKKPVSSPAALETLSAVLLLKLGLVPLARLLLKSFVAVQIPVTILGMSTATERMIARFHRAGVQVHFWTINDPAQMTTLVAAGADGIVTDRTDLAVGLFRS